MLAVVIVVVTLAGCGGDDTPEPVAVETACAAGDGATVEVTGFFRLPRRVSQTDRATIDLFTRRGGRGDRVSVELVLGTAPNQLERLTAGFTPTSLRITGATGTVYTLNDAVTITATVDAAKAGACVLREVEVRPGPGTRPS